ncbi:MAG: calcium-binding protein [Clostridiales bacterium]
MDRIEKNDEIEDRIIFEVIVDAYDEYERSMGWYYYIAENIEFPFKAVCIRKMGKSPLAVGEEVNVIDISEDSCDDLKGMYMKINWNNRSFEVPLEQLNPLNVDDETRKIIGDWHYWVDRGYDF